MPARPGSTGRSDKALRTISGTANARLAYEVFEGIIASERGSGWRRWRAGAAAALG